MKVQKEEFLRLSEEVKLFCERMENSEYHSKISAKYKGFQILFSALHYNPTFMFVGINPGAGFYNVSGNKVKKFLPENKLEYSNKEMKYAIARETRHFFNSANIPENQLENAVKTNFYFIASSSEPDLNFIIDALEPLEFEAYSKNWNERLIKLIKPKILICEGLSAFKKITEGKDVLLEDYGNTMYSQWNDIEIIGYKRRRSNIRDKEELVSLLKNSLSKIS